MQRATQIRSETPLSPSGVANENTLLAKYTRRVGIRLEKVKGGLKEYFAITFTKNLGVRS